MIGNRVARHLGAGIEASRSRAHVIERNTVTDNRQAGILLAGTVAVRVTRNRVHANAGPGIWLFDGSSANDVLANTVAANGSGIAVTLGGGANRPLHRAGEQPVVRAVPLGPVLGHEDRPRPDRADVREAGHELREALQPPEEHAD
jgi:parallel beta-helix repeat protein